MSSNHSHLRSPASRRSLFSSLIVTAALSLAVRGGAATTVEASAPPAYPDSYHVFNGCHISSVTYLARFTAEFPAEHGHINVAVLRNADGSIKPHSMALVTWQGEWWCRDEYFGVFRLHCPASGAPDLRRLERLFEDQAVRVNRRQPVRPPEAPDHFSADQRLHDVTAVAAGLPFANTIFWVHQDKHEVPVVFFRPAPGVVAVYDPTHGTAVAECALADDVRVASALATKLGYRADAIHRDFSAVGGALVAATAVPAAALAR